MSHANARLTVHGRRLIVQRHRQGWAQAHIAAAMGVSRKCVHTWIARFEAEGDDGLVDRSSRPHHCRTRTSSDVEAAVLEHRRTTRQGRDGVAADLGLAPRTVSRILARHHVPHISALDPMTGEVIRASKVSTALEF
ncbi:leucine zipper domain-containing protein [Demequina phytophila]|uniref:leucine zipper domain-containing protein n=1 Tax=Demequina phytophila TaxID=1638981 RepID=UPI000784CB8F|nr:leucine zipper domain-containing protein [Demequina phytophila]